MEDLILYGGPGCGKTEAGLNWLFDRITEGADLHSVAFVSYTNAAVDEARERIAWRFGMELDRDSLPYTHTLHALAKKSLHVDGDWLADSHLREFAEEYGYDLKRTRKSADEEGIEGIRDAGGQDSAYLNVWDFGRQRLITDPDEALSAFTDYDPDGAMYLRRSQLLAFVADYEKWKRDNALRDYTDLLLEYLDHSRPLGASVAVIDEAQDLSPLMWAVADALFADAEYRAVLGDDDQAIYSFSGAEPSLMNGRSAKEKVKLRRSYRLPAALVAGANWIIEQNSDREPKELEPVKAGGVMERAGWVNELPLDNGKTWFLLSRNWKLIPQFVNHLTDIGMPYRMQGNRFSPWNDSAMFRAAVAIRELGDGRAISLKHLWDLAQYTPSGNSKKPGVWTHGSKKRLEDLAAQDPHQAVTWRDMLPLGMTSESFARLMHRDLNLLDGKAPAETILTYQSAVEAGRWGNDPKVTVGSIHSVKGKERDCVGVLMACTAAPWRALQRSWRADEERRVAYVAATRAKDALYGVQAMPTQGLYPWETLGL